jgi:hypothetical protein
MIAVIEQPSYLPWLGYFDLMRQADVWVWYDDVQYTRRDWRNRNLVARDGAKVWLTVPVRHAEREAKINQVDIDYSRSWPRKHLETLRHCYHDAPWFDTVHDLVAAHLGRSPERLADLVIDLGEAIARLLGIGTRFLRSSQLTGIAGVKQGRLLEVCDALGATIYLSGPSARAYIDPAAFAAAGLELRYILYGYPPYLRGGQPFVPDLSILDPLAWIGPTATAELVAAGGRYEVATGLPTSVPEARR